MRASGTRQNASGEGSERMEIRTVKEKEPELKLKKEAEIAVHKGNPAVTKKEHQIVCSKESGSALFEKRYEEDF